MESVLQRFVDFVEMNNHNVCNADIDILPFIEVVDRTTPAIKNSVTEEEGYPLCFRAMPEIVLINFCRNVGDITFPMSGLLALKDIVTKDVDDEDSRLSMILLIHLTKMQFSIRDAAMYYSDFTCIIGNVDTTDARCWLEIGNLVLAHTTIIKSINNLLKNVFGQQFAERVDKTESVPITVKMVDTRESQLRGFTGINQIYINYGCFITKKFQIDRSTLSNELKTMLIIIDVATVAIHEYAHARAQQVTDNFNLTTSTALRDGFNESDPEFGRMAEKMFFRVAIDWTKSFKSGGVSEKYLASFIKAIRDNTELPTLPTDTNVIAREGPILMRGGGGCVDIETENNELE